MNALTALFINLQMILSGHRPVLALAPAGRLGRSRGVTFIEYALLAAIAVFIAWLFRGALTGAFNSILKAITEALNTNSSTR